MKKIVRLTESDLTKIVRQIIFETESSTQHTTIVTKPITVNAIKFNQPMDYDSVEEIMKTYGSSYRFPNNWDAIKDTYNNGEFWTNQKHGTYNISYYDMKDKSNKNSHRNDKKYLLLIKK